MKKHPALFIILAVLLPYAVLPFAMIFFSDFIPYDHGDSELIHLTSYSGKTSITKLLLNMGKDPDLLSEWGDTPMARAIDSYNSETVELLLEYGADPDFYAEYVEQLDPFEWSSSKLENGYSYIPELLTQMLEFTPRDAQDHPEVDEYVKIVTLLLDDYPQGCIDSGITLFAAIEAIDFSFSPEVRQKHFPVSQLVQLIRDRGLEIADYSDYYEDRSFISAFHYTISADEFRFLIAEGVIPSDNQLRNLIEDAIILNDISFLDELLPLSRHIANREADLFEILDQFNYYNDDLYSEFSAPAFAHVFANGLDVNTVSSAGYSLLMKAVVNYDFPIIEVCIQGGADKGYKNNDGHTAYDLALKRDFPEDMQELLMP